MIGWSAATVVVGMAVGGLAAFDATVAAAVTTAVALGLVLVARPYLILPLLVGSIFVEATTLGGITISRLLAPAALLVLLAVASRDRVPVRAAAPLAFAGAYALWAIVSGFWTIDSGLTWGYLGSLGIALVYMVAIAGLLRSERDLHRVGLTLAFAALALGLFAITDALFGIGWTLQGGRAAGGTGDPNYFAVYQVIALPVTIAMAAHARSQALRTALYAAAAVIVLSVFVSVSRGGLLTLAAVSLLAFVLPARSLFRSPMQKAVIFGVLLVGLAFTFQSAANEIGPRFRALAGGDETGSGRTGLWMAGWTGIKERPLLGLGYGAFRGASNDLILRTPGVDLRHYELRPDGHEAHNMYISTTADLGVPGLVLLLGILAASGRSFRRTAAQAMSSGKPFLARVSNALFLSLLAFALASIFLSAETSRALWILVGLALALPKLMDEPAADVLSAP
jgi:O-antigen ligase